MQTMQLRVIPQAPAANNQLTMSSREIAELVNSRHDKVKQSIERLAERGVIQLPPMGEVKNDKGQTVKEYRIGKRDSYVIVAQLSPEFTARLVDRWQELEEQAQQPDLHKALNDPASLRNLLLENVEKVLALESKIEADKPKTQFYDQFVNADGLYPLQNGGRAIACKPNLFCRWLKQDYLFYQVSSLVPRVRYIQMGIFEVKSTIVEDKARPQTFITPKGLEYLAARVPEHIRLRGHNND